jgi:hypothetical protein
MRLETEDGLFVARVHPMLPIEPGPIVIWGQRIFLRLDADGRRLPWRGHVQANIWREVNAPTVVVAD